MILYVCIYGLMWEGQSTTKTGDAFYDKNGDDLMVKNGSHIRNSFLVYLLGLSCHGGQNQTPFLILSNDYQQCGLDDYPKDTLKASVLRGFPRG